MNDVNDAGDFELFRTQLRAFVARRVPAAEVDDLVQEIHVKLARVNTEDIAHLSGFVHRVARNAIVDHHRRRRPMEPLALEPSTAPPVDHDPSPLVASWLGPMVSALPEPWATTLRMTELEGLTHEEVAEQLGVARSTVTSRVSRGRVLLREKLVRCCTIELDARGHVVGWEPNDSCCD